MALKKILLTCNTVLPIAALDWLKDAFEVKTAGCALEKQELIERLRGVVGLIMGGAERIDLEVLQKTALRWIVFVGIQWETFFSNEAREYLKEKGVPVFATGGGGSAVVRSTLDEIENWMLLQSIFSRRGAWNPGSAKDLLKQLDVSIIGAGNIGAKLLKALQGKCRSLKYYEAFGERPELAELGIPRETDLKKAFRADIVSIHMAFVQGVTENSIKADYLREIAAGGVLINNARAELIALPELLEFLKSRPDVVCIFDVFYAEGKEFEGRAYKEITGKPSFFFTQHAAVLNNIELAGPEYAEGLMKAIRENNLAELN